MRVAIFCHSLVSDWNHGNAHFLRGVVSALMRRGHHVSVFEPADGWSLQNLMAEHGGAPIEAFASAFPQLRSRKYSLGDLDIDAALDGADLVLVHEWNEPELVRRIGAHRAANNGYSLLFHDTHHRSVTDPDSMARFDLRHYDGVLAFGNSVAEVYRRRGWSRSVWTWHEAADTTVFFPIHCAKERDLIWIGNWGDDERTAELEEFLIGPIRALGLSATIHGVRYPGSALEALKAAGIEYRGWTANFLAPQIFAHYRVTVHVPRRPYATALRGVPTIRVFEALACGIPLVSAPWDDSEGLFTPGEDFLFARDGAEMRKHLRMILNEPESARALAASGLATIHARHTCDHRVDELLRIYEQLKPQPALTAGGTQV